MISNGTDNGELDQLIEQYQTAMRAIGNLPELAMRREKLGSMISDLEIEHAVWWIDQLIRGALWGRSPEIDGMAACSDWLIRLRISDDYELIKALYLSAHESKRESILYMLVDHPPHRELGPSARLPEVRLPIPRNVTMGEKRWYASGNDRRILERLVHDNEPLVIQKLLLNPHILLADVLAIASRRPTRHELLEEVVLSKTWIREHKVREALVQNPYILTGIALKLLPTLNVQVLRKLRFAGDLHPSINESAKLCVELREQRTAPWGH